MLFVDYSFSLHDFNFQTAPDSWCWLKIQDQGEIFQGNVDWWEISTWWELSTVAKSALVFQFVLDYMAVLVRSLNYGIKTSLFLIE